MCRRGEIYWLDLTAYSQGKGSLYTGVRPILIVQNNVGNKYSPTTIIAPITSRLTKAKLPTHIEIGRESGVDKPSVVTLEQLITINKCDLGDYIGIVPFEKVCEIDRALIISGGINIQNQITNVIDRERIKNLISSIKDTDEMLKVVDNDYFKKVKRLLLSELKSYCQQCGANYENLLKINNIDIEKIENVYCDRIRLAR